MTSMDATPTFAILLDLPANLLRFQFGQHPGGTRTITAPAIIDIGEAGKLIGVEATLVDTGSITAPPIPPDAPLDITTDAFGLAFTFTGQHATSGLSRAAETTVTIAVGPDGTLRELAVPRRGEGYEITWPSGNR